MTQEFPAGSDGIGRQRELVQQLDFADLDYSGSRRGHRNQEEHSGYRYQLILREKTAAEQSIKKDFLVVVFAV